MSVADDGFTVDPLSLDPLESGTTVLLTGEDTDALKSVFSRLVAADDDERSIVLATNAGGRSVRRELNDVKPDAGDRLTVLTCEGPSLGEDVQSVEDIADLTSLGMEFSQLVATSQQRTPRFRTGIFLCSTICSEIEDTRSVYRFLNTNFMTEIRRGDGIGICAMDTSADIGADMNSTIAGLETSFKAHVTVEKTGPQRARLDVSDLPGADETVEVSL